MAMAAIASLGAQPWHWQQHSGRIPTRILSTASPNPPPPAESELDTAAVSEEEEAAPPALAPGACKGCGRAEVSWGCNGLGRIQGGIAAVPGLAWWPIKAYRPCPAFLESGGRYKRQGQKLEEFAYGRRIDFAADSSSASDASTSSSSSNKSSKKKRK